MKHVFIIVLIFLFFFSYSWGQQDPIYTQYQFNIQGINPAYAGTWNSMGFTSLSRLQWIGFEGAPQTHTLTIQTPLTSENVAGGLGIVVDNIGREKRVSLFADYSYRLCLNSHIFLRLGLRSGFSTYNNRLTEYQLDHSQGPDIAYQYDLENNFYPNFGLGAFLYSDRYYLGLSLPKLLENDLKMNVTSKQVYSERIHYFLMGGYIFPVINQIEFKPTFLARWVEGTPLAIDVSTNILINNTFWVGLNYRQKEILGATLQWIFNNELRIGYSYETSIGDFGAYNDGTHEVMVSFQLKYLKTKFANPRYF